MSQNFRQNKKGDPDKILKETYKNSTVKIIQAIQIFSNSYTNHLIGGTWATFSCTLQWQLIYRSEE